MVTSNLELTTKVQEDLLWLRARVLQGEDIVLEREIDSSDQVQVVQLRDEVAPVSGLTPADVEMCIAEAVLPERTRWLEARNRGGNDTSGDVPSPGATIRAPVRSMRDEWADFQQRLSLYRGRDLLGLRTGMPQLDERTLGLRGVIVLGAMPNVGKTALTTQLGLDVVRNNADACFLMISLEMARYDLYTRVYCNLAQMDYSTLMFGNRALRGTSNPFTADEQARLKLAQQWINDNGHRVRILDRENLGPELTAASVLAELGRLKTETGTSRALIAIDYLQLIPVPAQTGRMGELEADKYRVRVVQDILAGTRSDSNPIGDAVLVISEARKPSGNSGKWGNSLADLMGTARVGYAADAVLLYRRMTKQELEESQYAFSVPNFAATLEILEARGIAPIVLTLAKGRDMGRGEWALEYFFTQSIFREARRIGGPPRSTSVRRQPGSDRPWEAGEEVGDPMDFLDDEE